MMNLSRANREISVVSDQIGSPTNAYDLAKVILDILENIENNKVQIYHFLTPESALGMILLKPYLK